ncbi:hypothetical protein ScPMuIL_006701 [Solemya velum]
MGITSDMVGSLCGEGCHFVWRSTVVMENSHAFGWSRAGPHRGCLGETTCFFKVGCFSNDPPFNNTEGALPLDPSFIQTTFHLYTRHNRDISQNLAISNITSITRSHFNAHLPIKIIIHGFVQNGRVEWIRNMARQILHKEDTNVIAVDWGKGAGFPYLQAAANTRVVGAEIAAFISFLHTTSATSHNQYHLIGHSLGAHVAGTTGQRVTGLERITGLDPAEPNFKGASIEARLDPTDAVFVDVIHTDGTEFNEISGYGMLDPLGHADFYPNGGVNQPGCPSDDWFGLIRSAYDNGVEATEDTLSCSHSRSIYLFIESINSVCQFTAFRCDRESFQNGECVHCSDEKCPSMGYHLDKSSRGTFYLNTSPSKPFCGYTYYVTVHFGHPMSPTRGTLNIRLLGLSGMSSYFQMESGNTRFQRNTTSTTKFVSRLYLGRLLQVQMHYNSASGWFSWGSRATISIGFVAVTSSHLESTLHSCGYNQVVGKSDVGFSAGSYTSLADCPSRVAQTYAV